MVMSRFKLDFQTEGNRLRAQGQGVGIIPGHPTSLTHMLSGTESSIKNCQCRACITFLYCRFGNIPVILGVILGLYRSSIRVI